MECFKKDIRVYFSQLYDTKHFCSQVLNCTLTDRSKIPRITSLQSLCEFMEKYKNMELFIK